MALQLKRRRSRAHRRACRTCRLLLNVTPLELASCRAAIRWRGASAPLDASPHVRDIYLVHKYRDVLHRPVRQPQCESTLSSLARQAGWDRRKIPRLRGSLAISLRRFSLALLELALLIECAESVVSGNCVACARGIPLELKHSRLLLLGS